MSGNTGKMTAAAIAERGPRLVLCHKVGRKTLLIISESQPAGQKYYVALAKSYSRSYLVRIANADREEK